MLDNFDMETHCEEYYMEEESLNPLDKAEMIAIPVNHLDSKQLYKYLGGRDLWLGNTDNKVYQVWG